MDSKRTIASIGRQARVSEQNMQHFISQSPWSSRAVIDEVQGQITWRGEVQDEAILIVDESADDKSGGHSAGAGRQHNGRKGKVDLSQVGVFLALVKADFWTWVDGEIFLPQKWFSDGYADQRQRAGIPAERVFMTKIELGWQMIQRARANGLPFAAVACDTLYGRSAWLRDQMAQAGIEYYADVPASTPVYRSEPVIGLAQGQRTRKEQVLSPAMVRVDQLATHPDTLWRSIAIRPCERGTLTADFAMIPIWTVRDDLSVHQEILCIRRELKGRCTYSLTNAAPNTPLTTLARRKTRRYFVERSNQDAQSEFGWDEFQAIKFLAWEHQLALTIMASWFVAETKLDWANDYAHDPALLAHYQTEVLPALSVANVPTLLCAALPWPQLSIAQATSLLAQHLDNRTRSRKSRLKYRTTHLGP
jgi:SRSO17 transposase